MDIKEKYPKILNAFQLIALDNGGINRNRPVEQQEEESIKFLSEYEQDSLDAIEAWLAALTDEQLDTFCNGEHTEMDAIAQLGPENCTDLFDEYFDEVC